MRSIETAPAHVLFARVTSGQLLDIRYDAATNAMVFVETHWSANARGPATAGNAFRHRLDTAKVLRLPRRAAQLAAGGLQG
jgi:hypothetical protein